MQKTIAMKTCELVMRKCISETYGQPEVGGGGGGGEVREKGKRVRGE